jgi:hypothetical protein
MLGVNEVQAMVQIIDMASARGAVRGEELAGIGQLRTKLVEVLQVAEEQNAKAREHMAQEARESGPAPTTKELPEALQEIEA